MKKINRFGFAVRVSMSSYMCNAKKNCNHSRRHHHQRLYVMRIVFTRADHDKFIGEFFIIEGSES